MVYIDSTTLLCKGIDASAGYTTGDIVIIVAGQRRASPTFRVQDGPEIVEVSPRSGPTHGGYNLQIIGSNFGLNISDVYGITIGGRPCTNVSRNPGGTLLNCTVPPGFGQLVRLEARVYSMRIGGEGLFRYDAPVVSSIDPSYLMAGTQTLDVSITGSSLASSLDVPGLVEIGGVACSSISVQSSSKITCVGLQQTGVEWDSSTVRLQAGDQSFNSVNLLTVYGIPTLSTALPALIPTDPQGRYHKLNNPIGEKHL